MTPTTVDRGAVLLVANYESDVGYAWWLMENFWHCIANAAHAQRRTCLLTYPSIGAIPELIRQSPVEVMAFSFGYRSWRDIWNGLALIRKHHIRTIYLTDWPYLHWLYSLWRLAGVRCIIMHDHTPGDRPALTGVQAGLKDLLHSLGVLSATTYVAVSSYIGARLRVNARVSSDRIVVVTNGIRLIDRRHVNRRAVRERIGVPQDAVLIVLVSRATYYKGIDFAIRCMERLLADEALRGKVHALHCGDGPDLQAFMTQAQAAGLSDNFHFLGRRSDVREILCASDIALHPSHGEAMSLAILEFMSAELAVMTSDLPSVCTAIDPGVTGVTYKHGDIEHAVQVLGGLVRDEPAQRRLGAAASASCARDFSLDAMNRAFVERVVPLL